MKTIIIEESKFQFTEFTGKILDFIKTLLSGDGNPSSLISKVDERGDEHCGPDEERSNFLEELQEGWRLFFPFSLSTCGESDKHECADGSVVEIGEESDLSFDVVGFLVELRAGSFTISSAIYWDGLCMPPTPPSVEVSDCGEFDQTMEEFIRGFIANN